MWFRPITSSTTVRFEISLFGSEASRSNSMESIHANEREVKYAFNFETLCAPSRGSIMKGYYQGRRIPWVRSCEAKPRCPGSGSQLREQRVVGSKPDSSAVYVAWYTFQSLGQMSSRLGGILDRKGANSVVSISPVNEGKIKMV
ncbi:hypothetical protein AVEN_255190-1 [Araneus ventricosus]|uniref:Uncharacterized protein n=1 Tax=Araneus ventricosus TaxID=182803 RepID=A0A4Y2BCN6_ARAVE|nr:hypothetical protein AVEN_255190-1 [Araneus ventricosus]